MRILFIYTNINGEHSGAYSFGLASLIAISKREHHFVRLFIVKNKSDYPALTDTVSNFSPDVVALTSVSSQYTFVKEIAEQIKSSHPNCIIACGGIHPTISPESILETDAIDVFFIGESELSFIDFLKKVEAKADYHDTNNICYKDGNVMKQNNLNPLIKDLDILPYPDKTTYNYVVDGLFDIMHAFMFSRGCPFHCSYCCNHALANLYGLKSNTSRYRSPELCIKEIEWTINKFKCIKYIWIIDDTFGLDKQWREEFCIKYQERIPLKFAVHLRANIVTEDLIKMLKSSGCAHISLGVESGNEYIRNTIMNRHMSNDQITGAFDTAHKYGIHTTAYNIIGVPGETEEMIWDTINLNRRINPTFSGVSIYYPYKRTILGDYCYDHNLVDKDLINDFSNERRESVLMHTDEFKNKLKYFHDNWESLVYPHDTKKMIKRVMVKNKFLRDTVIRMKEVFA